MAIRRPVVSMATLYLILSGPVIADAMRATVTGLAANNGTAFHTSEVREQEGTLWCNPFSSLPVKYYKVEQVLSGENCEVGNCNAYELVRDKKDPVLKIHHGQSWSAKFEDEEKSDKLVWSLDRRNLAVKATDEEFQIKDAEFLMFGEANTKLGLPDYMRMKFPGDHDIKINGGLFFQDDLVANGIKKLRKEADMLSEEEERAKMAAAVGGEGIRKHGIVKHNGRKGAKIGVAIGAVTFGLSWAAAAAVGTVVSNTALLSAGLVLSIGGALAGGILGAGVGAAVGVAGIIGIVKLLRNKGLSGAEKIFKKMQCIPGFTVCSTRKKRDGQRVTTMVPTGKRCPSDEGAWSFWG